MLLLWDGRGEGARGKSSLPYSNWPHYPRPRGSTDAFHSALCYLPIAMARPQSRASAEESYFWIGVRALPLIVRIVIFASACVPRAISIFAAISPTRR